MIAKNEKPMFLGELLPGSYSFMDEQERLLYCGHLHRQINGLISELPKFHHFDSTPLCDFLLDEFRKNAFPDSSFEDNLVMRLTRSLWFQALEKNYPLSSVLDEFFVSALALRERMVGETTTFRQNHPDFPDSVTYMIWSYFSLTWTNNELLTTMDALAAYPNLLTPEIFAEVISMILLNESSYNFQIEPHCVYLLAAFSRFVALRNTFNKKRSGPRLNLDNFIVGDKMIFEKFRTSKDLKRYVHLIPKLHPFVQIGVYLKALDDGLGELSIENLCSIYGVDPK